jgi:hypothetical protein
VAEHQTKGTLSLAPSARFGNNSAKKYATLPMPHRRVSAAWFPSVFRSRNNVSRSFVERMLIAFSIAAADKILRVNESPGGLSRLRVQDERRGVTARQTHACDRPAPDACYSPRAKSTIKGGNVTCGLVQLLDLLPFTPVKPVLYN